MTPNTSFGTSAASARCGSRHWPGGGDDKSRKQLQQALSKAEGRIFRQRQRVDKCYRQLMRTPDQEY